MTTEDSRDGISHERQTSMQSSTGDAAVGGVAFQSGRRWAYHLSIHPEDGCRCDWAKLTGRDWAKLLSAQPQFAEKCKWRKLDGADWIELLNRRPAFADGYGIGLREDAKESLDYVFVTRRVLNGLPAGSFIVLEYIPSQTVVDSVIGVLKGDESALGNIRALKSEGMITFVTE